MRHGAQGAADPAKGCSGPTWTYQGQPLAHLWQDNPAVHWHPWSSAAPPNRHASISMDGLGDEASVKRARIEVERIQSPVLLVSGLDDRAWPSSLYSRMVADALARSGHAHVVRHLEYANAGYGIHFSYLPATQIARLHPISGVPYTNGGAPGANAFANEQSWQGVLAFLRQALIDCH